MAARARREPIHGRRSTYVGGCRCDACRAVEREYHRSRRTGAPFAGARRATVAPEGWLTVPDAARRLGLTVDRMYGCVRRGEVETLRREGRVFVRLPAVLPPELARAAAKADPPPGLVTPAEAGAILGVGRDSLRGLVASGELPAVRWQGSAWYRRTDLDAYLEAHRVPPGSMGWAWQRKDPETGRWRWSGRSR